MRVLVADDEKIIADTLVLILKSAGYVAAAAYTGETAIATAATFQPQLLITDVVMEPMNGIEAALQIKTMFPDCEVMLFSGQPTAAALLEEAEARGHSFEIWAKPVAPDDLIARVRTIAAESGQWTP